MLSILSSSLLIASAGYFNFVVAYKYFFDEGSHDFYSTYFLLLMFSLFLLSLWPLKGVLQKLKTLKFKLNVPWLFLTLFFVGVAVLNTQQEFQIRDIWLDEYSQFRFGTPAQLKLSNLVRYSAIEQQPPLDYYLSSIAFTYFGWKDYAVRFHAIIFYFLTILTLSSFLYLRSKNFLITTLGLTLHAVSYALRFFSIEGRPVTMASFFGLLFLIEAIRYFDEEREVKFSIPLLLSIVLFSLSVGLQPVTIIFLLSIILTTFFYLSGERNKAIYYFFHNVIGALLILPILYNIYAVSLKLHQFVEPESAIGRIINNFELGLILQVYDLQFMSLDFGGILTVIFILFLFYFSFFFRENKKWLNISLATFLLLFPPYFLTLFYGTISWGFYTKYYICYTLISLTVCSLLFADVLTLKPIKRSISLPLILLLMTFSWWSLRNRDKFAQFGNSHVYSKRLYDYLGASDDINVAINLNFPKLGQWRGGLWISNELYSSSKVILHKFIQPFEYNFFVKWDQIPKGEFVRISLLEKMHKSLYKHSIQEFMNEVVPDHEVREFGILKVYSFRTRRDTIKEFWRSFLMRLERKLPKDYAYLFRETELTESILNKDYEGCLKVHKEFKAIKTKAFMDGGAEIDGEERIRQLAERYSCERAKKGLPPMFKNSNTLPN